MSVIRITLLSLGVLLSGTQIYAQVEEPKPAEKVTPFPEVPPRTPEESIKAFQLLHGFEMEVVAAEPLVTDPVAICYDEFGNAYVAEMIDYPYTDKAKHKPRQENPTDKPIGRVRRLVDTDNDGVFDESTIFAEGLSWPTGVACWDGGVFVTATPDILYFKDTDGDGVSDVKKKLYTGFRKYNVQSVFNGPIWALDGKYYFSGATNGGTIVPGDNPDAEPIRIVRNDLVLDPRSGELELESGYGRFGHTFDDYGNRFVCNIRNPAVQIVMPLSYLKRNQHLSPIDARQDICNLGEFIPVVRRSPLEAWRAERAERWANSSEAGIYPSTELVAAGAVTSACGVTVYRGDAWPEEYRGQIFVSDVASNLFFRLVLTPDGASFQGVKGDKDEEFGASDEVWSRITNFTNAPDGCLHVVDMYRESIEHPWSIPDDIHARIDLERGRDKGRIYRLQPAGFKRQKREFPGNMDEAGRIALLGHRNSWHRDTAQRLLLEQGTISETGIASIRKLVRSSNDLGKITAGWLLAAIGQLQEDDLVALISDESAQVRTSAYRIVLSLENGSQFRTVVDNAFGSSESMPAGTELFHALANISSLENPKVRERVEALLKTAPLDDWQQYALLSASAGTALDLVKMGIASRRKDLGLLLAESARISVKLPSDQSEILGLLRSLVDPELPNEVVTSVASGLAAGAANKGKLLAMIPKEEREPILARITRAGAELAANSESDDKSRLRAVNLLGFGGLEGLKKAAPNLFNPDTPMNLQSRLIQMIGAFDSSEVPQILMSNWPELSPVVRQQVAEALLSRSSRWPALMAAISEGTISPHFITRARRKELLEAKDEQVAEMASKVFGDARGREAVIVKYREAIPKLKGDPTTGRAVFDQNCSACHKMRGYGFGTLGPNLSTVTGWDLDQLIVNILDPNRDVPPAFIEYLIEKNDGSSISGSVLNETSSGVLLRLSDGSRTVVSKAQIKKMENSGMSLMPEGFEHSISPEAMAHLIAYLKSPGAVK